VPVHFINVYKFNKETGELWSFRSFIRDYDGAIREIHITKKPIPDEMKEGLIGNLPPRADRKPLDIQQYGKDSEPSEEDKYREDGDEEEKGSLKNSQMHSQMNLRDGFDSARKRGTIVEEDESDEDGKINRSDRRIDDEDSR
jgi:hypothetical protein